MLYPWINLSTPAASIMNCYIFAQGFAFSKAFWCNILPYFKRDDPKALFLFLDDLVSKEYPPTQTMQPTLSSSHCPVNCAVQFADQHTTHYSALPEIPDSAHYIGVGHSLGFLKLLRSPYPFTKVIGINAFTSFLGYSAPIYSRRIKEHKAFTRSFTARPLKTLERFYKNCGLDNFELNDEDPNLKDESMTSLSNMTIDCQPGASITSLPVIPNGEDLDLMTLNVEPTYPACIINAKNDTIVPYDLTMDNFSKKPDFLQSLHILPRGQHLLGYSCAYEVYAHVQKFLN